MPSSLMIFMILYLAAAAAARLSMMTIPKEFAPPQSHDAPCTTSRGWQQNSSPLLLTSSPRTPRLAAPSFALLFRHLITDSLQVNAHPVRRHGHVHICRAIHHERASGAIEAAKASQEDYAKLSTANTDDYAAGQKRMAKSGLTYGVVAQFDGPSLRTPQRGMLPCDHQGLGKLRTPLALDLSGDRLQDSMEVLQPLLRDHVPPSTPEPSPDAATSGASQRTRRPNWSLLLAVVALFVVLSELLGMANAANPGTVLGDSPVSVIPVANSTPSSLSTATSNSTSSSSVLQSATQLMTATPTTSTAANTATNTEALISITMTLPSIPNAVTQSPILRPTSNAPSPSLTPNGDSSYTTVISTNVAGPLSVKAGFDSIGSTTTERFFVFLRTTLAAGINSTSTDSTKPLVSSATATSSNTSSSVAVVSATRQPGNMTVVYVTKSPTFSGAIGGYTTFLPTTGQVGQSSNIAGSSEASDLIPSQVPVPTANVNGSLAMSYMRGSATVTSFIPAVVTTSSATILPITGNVTLGSFNQTSTPFFPNGTTRSVTGTIYTTVTSTKSVVITSTIVANASASHFASGARSITLVVSNSTSFPAVHSTSSSTTISAASMVSISLGSIAISTLGASRTGSSTQAGSLSFTKVVPITITRLIPVTSGGASKMPETSYVFSLTSSVTGAVSVSSQPQVSPQTGLFPVSTSASLSQQQASPQTSLTREESSVARGAISAATSSSFNLRALDPAFSQLSLSLHTSAPGKRATIAPLATTAPSATTAITSQDKRKATASVSFVYITVTETTYTPVHTITKIAKSTIDNPWLDTKSKFKGYTYGICSQDQYMYRSRHNQKPSIDPLSMGFDCILPITSATQTPDPGHRYRPASLPHGERDEHTVVGVTVTSYFDETYPSSASLEDISDPPTELPTSAELSPTPAASRLGFGFDQLSVEPRKNHVTTGLGFTPTMSFAPRPTEVSAWTTIGGITIPPLQNLPSFLTYRPAKTEHPTSSAVASVGSDSTRSPNPFDTIAYPESETTTSSLDPTAAELLRLTSDFSQTTALSPAAAANVLLEYETKLVSSEMESWEENQATAVPPTVSPVALIPAPVARGPESDHCSSFVTGSREGIEKAITCASPLIPSRAPSTIPGSPAQPDTSGVCPSGWIPISSGGGKRIKRWFAAEVIHSYIIAGLVIELRILGGVIASAVEGVGEVVGGVGIRF